MTGSPKAGQVDQVRAGKGQSVTRERKADPPQFQALTLN